jgi:hypothetical protein
VNLAEGHGFSYDGLAGYDTWFANWPILYPAMIAAVMRLGGSEAYLASKILTMVMVGLLLLVVLALAALQKKCLVLCALSDQPGLPCTLPLYLE